MATLTPSDVIDGVVVVAPDIHGDERGIFIETYRRNWFPGGREMIQGNRGDRRQGALVGLHYHLHQADYWYVPHGHGRVVLHDLREGSSTCSAVISGSFVDRASTAGAASSSNGTTRAPRCRTTMVPAPDSSDRGPSPARSQAAR